MSFQEDARGGKGDDRRRSVRIPDLVPYFTGVEFKVIELDDTSPDDIGRQTLRPRDELIGWSEFTSTKTDPDQTLRGCLGWTWTTARTTCRSA